MWSCTVQSQVFLIWGISLSIKSLYKENLSLYQTKFSEMMGQHFFSFPVNIAGRGSLTLFSIRHPIHLFVCIDIQFSSFSKFTANSLNVLFSVSFLWTFERRRRTKIYFKVGAKATAMSSGWLQMGKSGLLVELAWGRSFSPNRPTRPIRSSSRGVHVSVCLSVCVLSPQACFF